MGDLEAYKEKVKASLPADAGADALAQALAKDAVWLKLKEQVETARRTDRQAWEAARAKVRAAIENEAHANQAVSEGRAKAIDGK